MRVRQGILMTVLLSVLAMSGAVADEPTEPIDRETLDRWSAPYRGWSYHPDHVIPARPEIEGFPDIIGTDVPTVYQIPGDDRWYMTFIGFDGKGYQSFVAESRDLVHWGDFRLAMGYGPEGRFDHGGRVVGAFLYESYDVKAPRTLKRRDGKFWTLYGAYPRQGGYELRPGYEGVAISVDGLSWTQAKDDPILSIFDPDRGDWEKDCIYQPWLVEHQGRFFNFYNAARGGPSRSASRSRRTCWTGCDTRPIPSSATVPTATTPGFALMGRSSATATIGSCSTSASTTTEPTSWRPSRETSSTGRPTPTLCTKPAATPAGSTSNTPIRSRSCTIRRMKPSTCFTTPSPARPTRSAVEGSG